MNAYLKLDHIDKHFDRAGARTEVLKDINLVIDKGEFVSIIGHSGCGKSTLLNLIAGLTPVSKGAVLLENREVNEPGPERAVVFQNHSLLPWLTVYENVNLAVSKVFSNKKSKAERHDWVMANLDLVQMAHAKDRRPSEISGGMKQRVGIARALSMEPKILLLDEPFASLDQHLRERLREEVRDIQQRLGITTLFVTHGQDEALALADRIVVMRDGRTEQVAPPSVIYREPQTAFVAGFIGSMNFVETEVRNGVCTHPLFSLPIPVADGKVTLAMRPEALTVRSANRPAEATVHRVTDFGTHKIVDIDLAGGVRLKAMVAPSDMIRAGMLVTPSCSGFFAFRDNALIHQSAAEAAATVQPLFTA